MRYAGIFLALLLSLAGSVSASANTGDYKTDPVEEIVITLADLDAYTAAMLRIYALSNEISLRVAAKKEDLTELHTEFNARVMGILSDWGFTIPRYNEIERASQLIPSIFDAIKERVLSSDQRLQNLAKSPKTLSDAKRLLRGKVNYPVTAETMPWFAEDGDLKGMAEGYMSGPDGKAGKGLIPGMGFPGR